MDLPRIRHVLSTYAELLRARGLWVERQDSGLEAPSQAQALVHSLWMCDEMRAQLSAQSAPGSSVDPSVEGKANRWLGFVQGVLWATGLRTIAAMRDDNR